jgi:hypothetical protein
MMATASMRLPWRAISHRITVSANHYVRTFGSIVLILRRQILHAQYLSADLNTARIAQTQLSPANMNRT